jgi:hypothetical protein
LAPEDARHGGGDRLAHARGTTEILKAARVAVRRGDQGGRYELRGSREKPEFYMKPATIGFDAVFGGGTFDHGAAQDRRASLDHGARWEAGRSSMSHVHAREFEPAQLEAWFGKNIIGTQPLYDPEQYWTGVALSGLASCTTAMCSSNWDSRSQGRLTISPMPDTPGGSRSRTRGSQARSPPPWTTILSNAGWERGWRVLREMCANTRYFTKRVDQTTDRCKCG